MIGIEVKHLLDSVCDIDLSVQEIQDLKIDDVKAMLEKVEGKKSAMSEGLVSTVSVDLPKSFYHPRPVEPLNDVREGTPLFFIDMDSDDLGPLRNFGKCVKRPAFVLVLSREAPMIDVPALASWFLQVRKTALNSKNFIGYTLFFSSWLRLLELGDLITIITVEISVVVVSLFVSIVLSENPNNNLN